MVFSMFDHSYYSIHKCSTLTVEQLSFEKKERRKKDKEEKQRGGMRRGGGRNEKERKRKKEKLLPNPTKVLEYYTEDSYLIRVNIQVLSLAT